MADDIQRIIYGIAHFEPTDEGWLELDQLLDELWNWEHPERGIEALLHIFERFPEDDGYGVFWSVLHGLEGLPGYEEELIKSVQRQPSVFGLLMVNRLLNSGQRRVRTVDLLALLKEVAEEERYTEAIRNIALRFAEDRRGLA